MVFSQQLLLTMYMALSAEAPGNECLCSQQLLLALLEGARVGCQDSPSVMCI